MGIDVTKKTFVRLRIGLLSTYLEVQRQKGALAEFQRLDHARRISYYRKLARVLRERPDLAGEGWSAERVEALLYFGH